MFDCTFCSELTGYLAGIRATYTVSDWALVYGEWPGPVDDGGPAESPPQGTVVTTSNMGELYVAGNILPPQNRDHYSTRSVPIPIPASARVTTYTTSDLKTRVVPSVGVQHRDAEEQALLDEIVNHMP